jgi:hypothetical protein
MPIQFGATTRLAARAPMRWNFLLSVPTMLTILILAGMLIAEGAAAQAQPPNRFFGTAKVNGQDQPDGTVIEAYVGNTLCGSGTVQTRDAGPIYFVDVLGAGQKPNCAKDGDKVTFKIAGLDAKETGTYTTSAATRVDLTATGTARRIEQPTVLAPGTGGTPAAPPSFTPAPNLAPPAASATVAAPTPSASGTPTTSSATPEATAAEAATETATETPTPSPVANAPAQSRNSSGGTSPIVWVGIIAVVLIGAGAAAWVYQRQRGA